MIAARKGKDNCKLDICDSINWSNVLPQRCHRYDLSRSVLGQPVLD